MPRHFDQDLRTLRDGLLGMGSQVESMLMLVSEAFWSRDLAKANQVIGADSSVDALELQLDQICIDLLALRGPLASDLRVIASSLKIIPELERIGDHSCNIAHRVKLLHASGDIPFTDLLERLDQVARSMVHSALTAFIEGDADRAREVIAADDEADSLYHDLYAGLLKLMSMDSSAVDRAGHLLLVAKNWERIADQATNIAEEVIFILEGRNVKHPYLQSPEA